MEDALIKGGGILGAIIVALGIYIMYVEKQRKRASDEHRKEREEWRVSDDKKFDRLNKIADDSKDVIKHTGDVIASMKTLLETRNGRQR